MSPNWLQKTLNAPVTVYALVLATLYLATFTFFFPVGIADNQKIYRLAQLTSGFKFGLLTLSIIVALVIVFLIIRSRENLSIKKSLLIILLCALPFIFQYPGDTADFIGNIWYAKRYVELRENPYQVFYEADDYSSNILPPTPTSPLLPYGPLWLIGQSAIYFAVQQYSLITLILIFKLVNVVPLIVLAALMLQAVSNDNRSGVVALFVSPFILSSFVGNAHNDIWMVLFMGWSFLKLERQQYVQALYLLTVSILFKYVSIILLPVIILSYLKEKTSSAVRDIIIWIVLFTASIVVLQMKYTFLEGILAQSTFVGYSLVNAISLVFHQTDYAYIAKSTLFGIFVSYYVLVIVQAWQEKRYTAEYIHSLLMGILSAFYLFALHLWNYWYLGWLLPFCIKLQRKQLYAFLALTHFHLVSYILFWRIYYNFVERQSDATLFVYQSAFLSLVLFCITCAVLGYIFIYPNIREAIYNTQHE